MCVYDNCFTAIQLACPLQVKSLAELPVTPPVRGGGALVVLKNMKFTIPLCIDF